MPCISHSASKPTAVFKEICLVLVNLSLFFFIEDIQKVLQNTSYNSERKHLFLGMFINSKKHTREACTHTFFFFFWIVTCSNMKKADCFFLPQPASFTTRGFLGLGAGAAPNEQRRSNAVAFRLAAGMLLMFLSCSLPLDFCGGGCIRVSLMASFSPVLARPLAKGLLLSRWLGWRCGRKRSVSVQSRCAVAWLFGVTK